MGSDSQDIQQHIGCGNDINLSQFTLNINTTTGGSFSVSVDSHTTVENLKKIVAKKLKVAKDRICLLHREKELHDGTSIKENGIMDGSKIILLPNVETGLLAQRPENTVMQALESLNDSQVNDFLSGRTPLNLSMRLGDHMMLIQLQLSTVNPTNSSASSSSTSVGSVGSSRTRSLLRSKTTSSAASSSSSSSAAASSTRPSMATHQSSSTNSAPIRFTNANHMYKSLSSDQIHGKYRNRLENGAPQPSTSRSTESIESRNDYEELRSIVNSLSKEKKMLLSSLSPTESKGSPDSTNDSDIEMESSGLLQQMPTKSTLSNLVTGPIKASALKNIPLNTPTSNNTTTSTSNTVKIASCPCKSSVEGSSGGSSSSSSSICSGNSSNNSSAPGCDMNCQYSRNRHQLFHKKYLNQSEVKPPGRSSILLHKTLNNAIAKTKSAGFQSIHNLRAAEISASNLRRSKSSDNISHAEQGIAKMVTAKSLHDELSADQPINIIDTTTGNGLDSLTTSDTLAEASRNLTKTLRKLSKEVFSSKGDATALAVSDERSRSNSSNAGAGSVGASGSSSSSSTSISGSSGSGTSTATSTGSHQSSTVANLGSGAVIESMRAHGRGIYSGTFSGTLNPALQDKFGRPKRDISTVIHILNDLLSATPHYSRGARISFEPAHSSRKYSSSKRAITGSSTSGIQSHHQRIQCSKCKSGCGADCIKFASRNNRHIHVTNDSTKSVSLPATPRKSIDCRQCQMPMSCISAPVSPNQSIQDESTSPNTSNASAFAFRDSNADLSTSPPTTSSSHPICMKCSNTELENSKTRKKLDQLRLVFQQRREKREARRTGPYARMQPRTATSINPNDSSNGTVIQTTVEAPQQVNTLA